MALASAALDFIDGSSKSFPITIDPTTLDLSSSLSTFERAMTYQYCDELGLQHVSVGSGNPSDNRMGNR